MGEVLRDWRRNSRNEWDISILTNLRLTLHITDSTVCHVFLKTSGKTTYRL